MSFRNKWMLATAGHILHDLEELLRSGTRKIHNSVLIDNWDTKYRPDETIPFDLEGAPKFYIDDEETGLDFALIVLDDYYRQLLEANSVVAVTEDNWRKQHNVEFEFYCLLGIPTERVFTTFQHSSKGRRHHTRIKPVFFPVDKLEEAPGIARTTSLPRFVATLPVNTPLKHMDGMSGGPVIGFAHDDSGKLRYWIVAIQSSWLPDQRVIFACPVRLFAGMVDEITGQ